MCSFNPRFNTIFDSKPDSAGSSLIHVCRSCNLSLSVMRKHTHTHTATHNVPNFDNWVYALTFIIMTVFIIVITIIVIPIMIKNNIISYAYY